MKRKRTQTRTRGVKEQPSMMELFENAGGKKAKKSEGSRMSHPSVTSGESAMSKIRGGKPWTDTMPR